MNSQPRPANPQRHRRRERRLSVIVTERDVLILRELFDSRILTTAQLSDIHFDGKLAAAKQRLYLLKRAKLIVGRSRTSPAEPEPLKLTRHGFDWLRTNGAINDFPRLTWASMRLRLAVSNLTIRHELEVGAVKAAIHRHVRGRTGMRIRKFVTWPRLLRFANPDGRSAQRFVSPDGFFRVVFQSLSDSLVTAEAIQYDAFLEVDRGTETIGRITQRAVAYLQHYKSGAYAKRNGGDPAKPQLFPFRVCWTFPSRSRLRNFADACRRMNPPILKTQWLATHEDVISDPLGPIWIRPGDTDDSVRHSLIATQINPQHQTA